MIDADAGFTLTREIDATPDAIWAAWTEPDEIAAWWHPRGMTTPRESVSVDLRPGGGYTYTMVDESTGEEYPTGGVYHEVDGPGRLAFTWGTPGADADETPRVTVVIESLGELTRLTFRLQGVAGFSGDGSYYDGWESALDVLVGHLGQQEVLG
jgi:uncharacterized protein YndB with AHSA1/START domain